MGNPWRHYFDDWKSTLMDVLATPNQPMPTPWRASSGWCVAVFPLSAGALFHVSDEMSCRTRTFCVRFFISPYSPALDAAADKQQCIRHAKRQLQHCWVALRCIAIFNTTVKVKVRNELIKRHKTKRVSGYRGAGYVTVNHCFQKQQ